ncbi:MAG: PhaM family polyhydroxyalkanoate granule multifunctional regulatory protein, partial [Burkholderiales bacterium]
AQESNMAQQPELPKDWLEFMQKMWNPMSFPMPGMAMPTVNVAEIDRKIAELKAVETWLTMQVGFLQMTVKTLEIQKAALESLSAAALKGKPGDKR